jgi:hypothetical protein
MIQASRIRRAVSTRAALALGAALLAAACSDATEAVNGPGSEVRAFTGARTRAAWVQGDGSDPFALGQNLVLMGFDSDDGRGEREIRGQRGSYMKPLFTPRGDRIVYSTHPDAGGPEVFIVNFDGSNWKRLVKGFALAVWENPADRSEWLYVGLSDKLLNFHTVTRFPIDAPAKSEVVWNKTLVSADSFQVSADGRHAGGLFPWPDAGVAELPNGSLRKIGDGCWTSMTSVRGPLFWYFDGAHRNLLLYDVRTEKRWTIPINSAPGFNNPEVYHPRWTNHPRFLTISGPYNRGGANQVRSGGGQADVWLGRFSENFGTVEGWIQVTKNSGGDSYPDVWIDRPRSPHAARPGGPVGPATAAARPADPSTGTKSTTPANTTPERVVLEGRLVHAGPVPSPQSILPYRHALVVSEYEVTKVVEGSYTPKRVRVAHWAIRDGRVLAGAQKDVGATGRLTIERYDSHPELEGERLITDLPASDLALYYDVAK